MRLYEVNQILLAVVLIAATIGGLRAVSGAIFDQHDEPRLSPYAQAALEEAEAPAAQTAGADNAASTPSAPDSGGALAISMATLIANADPGAGEKHAAICKACHSFDRGGPTLMGPNLWGIVGRQKAAASGFAYSPALQNLGGAWSYDDLDAFLKAPSSFANGTKMAFGGLKSDETRAAVIAYLRSQAESPAPLPAD